jgi:uncharacterized membrane protein (DUF4010 family)
MDIQDLLPRLALALGIGLLIGIERGWKTRDLVAGSRAAGIRTFAISGLLGGLLAAVGKSLGGSGGATSGLVIGLGFAAYAAVITIFSRDANRAQQTYSATTAIAALVTFALGSYAVLGDERIAAAAAVATAGLLASRQALHGWVEQITWPELRSGLVLLAMTFVALPIVPDEAIGPFGGVNPREVWLIAIVLAGVSFIGYGAMRYFGATRGVLLAAAAGGLVSSTAVTVSNARLAAAGNSGARLLAAGAILSTAISLIRVCVIVAIFKIELLAFVAPALLAAAIVAAAYAFGTVYWRRDGDGESGQKGIRLNNPFKFWPVVGFAMFLAAIIVLGRAVGESLGTAGAIAGAAAVGLADVDAITISMTRLAPETLGFQSAALAILTAVASNTMSKLAIGAAMGHGRFAVELAAATAACLAAAAIALWATIGLVSP